MPKSPEASPLLASPSQLAAVPNVLRGEGIAFAKASLEAGARGTYFDLIMQEIHRHLVNCAGSSFSSALRANANSATG